MFGLLGIQGEKGNFATVADKVFEDIVNWDAISEVCGVYPEKEDFEDEEEFRQAEKRFLACEQEEMDIVYKAIVDSLGNVTEKAFRYIDISVSEAVDARGEATKPPTFVLTPNESWEQSGRKIWEIIECLGFGTSNTYEEFKEQEGEISDFELVRENISIVKDAPSCYGKKSIERLFTEGVDDYLKFA